MRVFLSLLICLMVLLYFNASSEKMPPVADSHIAAKNSKCFCLTDNEKKSCNIPSVSYQICNVSSSEKSYFDKSLRRCCSQCPPGTKVSKVCTATQDTQCEECPLGHFTDIWHTSLDCERCNNHCDEKYNLIEVQPCRNQTQRKCDCKPGYICTYLMSSTCLTCTPIVIPDDQPSKNKTLDCSEGTFLNKSSNNCVQHTDCHILGKKTIFKGNATADAVCQDKVSTPDRIGSSINFVCIIIVGIITAICILAFFIQKCVHKVSSIKLVFRQCCNEDIREENGNVQPKGEQLIINPSTTESIANNSQNDRKNDTAQCTSYDGSGTKDTAHLDLDSSPISTNSTDSTSGLFGPLHIYSPGTVIVGLINNVQDHSLEPNQHQGEPRAENTDLSKDNDLHYPEQEHGTSWSFRGHPQKDGKDSHISKEEHLDSDYICISEVSQGNVNETKENSVHNSGTGRLIF